MNTHDFFDFRCEFSSSIVQVHVIGIDHTPDPSGKKFFDSARLLVGDYGSIHFPVLVKQEKGRKWDDILNTGYINLYLISDRIRNILEENNLTGWKTFSIKLLDKKGNEMPGYQGLSITGRCDPIDYSKGKLFQKRILENGPLWNFYKGFHIELNTWDGSDFFLPKRSKGIIVTAKAAGTLMKHKINNLVLKNLLDVELDESTVKLNEKNKNRVGHW